MQVQHRVAVLDFGDEAAERVVRAERPRERIGLAAVRVVLALRSVAADRRRARARRERRAPDGLEAGAVVLIVVAVVLVVRTGAEVVRERAAGVRAAGLERDLAVHRRRAGGQRQVPRRRRRAGANDLVDVARDAVRFGVRRRRAGVDLELLLAERGDRPRRVVVERAVHRDAVELVADLVVVSAANADRRRGADVAGLAVRDEHSGDGRDRGPRAVEVAAAADARGLVLRHRIDRVDVGGRAGLHQRGRGAGGYRTDDFELDRLRQRDHEGLVRLHRHAAHRRGVARFSRRGGDRVRIGIERDEREAPAPVGRGRRRLGRAGGRHARSGDGLIRLRVDDGTVDCTGRACQNACRSLEHERNEQQHRDDRTFRRGNERCHSFFVLSAESRRPRASPEDEPALLQELPYLCHRA